MHGEPWCLTPAQFAELTNWQIEHVYLRPAVERARQLRAEASGERPDVPPLDMGGGVDPPGTDGSPSFEQLMYMAQVAGADVNELKKWHAAQAGN